MTGSRGPIVSPRKPTITRRAAFRRSAAGSAVGLGDGESVGSGLGVGEGLGLGPRLGVGAGEGDGDGEPGEADGEAVRPPHAASPTPTDPATKARSSARLEMRAGWAVHASIGTYSPPLVSQATGSPLW